MSNLTKQQKKIIKAIQENPGKIIVTAEQGLGKNQKPYVLQFCETCIQMTNHIKDVCQKCKK